jgi:hypothetical protein
MALEQLVGAVQRGQDIFLLTPDPLEIRFLRLKVELQRFGLLPQSLHPWRRALVGRRLSVQTRSPHREPHKENGDRQELPANRRPGGRAPTSGG